MVAWDWGGDGGGCPSPLPHPCCRPLSPSCLPLSPWPQPRPSLLVPTGRRRTPCALGPGSRLRWYGTRPARSPRRPRHLPRAPPAGPGSRSPPGGARQLSRAPRGPRQASNLLLFVECFCHANPRAGRWHQARRRWGVFAFFSLPLAFAVGIVSVV